MNSTMRLPKDKNETEREWKRRQACAKTWEVVEVLASGPIHWLEKGYMVPLANPNQRHPPTTPPTYADN
jgi:hypothetical protein